jgi:putative cell wall-binding protein
MSRSLSRASQRTFAGLLAGVLALAAVLVTGTAAGAVEEAQRIGGDPGNTRVETAIDIAEAAHPDGVTDVVLTTSAVAADSLSANALAGALDGALLLTEPTALNPNTAQALTDLGAENVWIVGGPAAVSSGIETTLAEDYTVARVEGDNRYETSAAVAERIVSSEEGGLDAEIGEGFGGQDTVLIARGDLPFDAVAGSALSYYGTHPILLTETDELPEAVNTALGTVADQAVILGGTNAVSAEVATAIGTTLESEPVRVEGSDRNDTAVALADVLIGTGDDAEPVGDFDASSVFLTTGAQPYDALTVGQLAGAAAEPSPILLTAGQHLSGQSGEPAAFLQANAGTIENLWVLGGTNAVPDGVVNVAVEATDEGLPSITATNPVEGDTTVTFTSDEALEPSSVEVGDFSANGTNVSEVALTSDGLTITVTVDAALSEGDTVTLNADSVNDLEGNAGPEEDVTATTGAAPDVSTEAPDLVSVGNVDADANTVEFTFDEAVTIVQQDGFNLIQSNGGVVDGLVAAVASGDPNTVVATMDTDIAADVVEVSARATVDAGAVTDAGGTANPLQSIHLSADGATSGPDLLSVTVSGDVVTYTFDEAVVFATGGGAGDFGAYGPDAAVVTGNTTSTPDPTAGSTTIDVTFGAGELTGKVVAYVDNQTVQTVGATPQTNRPDSGAIGAVGP